MKGYVLFTLIGALLTAAFISAFVYHNSLLAVVLSFVTLLSFDKLSDDRPKQKTITDQQESPKISSRSVPVSDKRSRGLFVPPPLN